MNGLLALHLEIDARVKAMREERPDWPCAKGCDQCCRHLAAIPRLTAVEWQCLQEGLSMLPAGRLNEVRQSLQILTDKPAPPVVCPLLEPETGICPVYAHRPVACRTYGFYVQREAGLYCRDLEQRVAEGAFDAVIWGNQNAIDRDLARLGEVKLLTEWFAGWKVSAG